MLDNTETFCQNKALLNALMKAVAIADDDQANLSKGAIPQILQDALGVSFDKHIGHDYLNDATARFDFYNRIESKISFDIDFLNTITDGGLTRKTLNVILAGTGVGKSLAMCSMAAANLMHGRNVLYVTLEMAEERIAERIDANLLNTPLKELRHMDPELYQKKIARIKGKTGGKLVIKEYPPTSAHANHFRHLINELKLKKNFTPDIIYIDYLNLAASCRMKMGNTVNSYLLIKSIAEEIRGLAVEFDVPIMTATQTNRSGFDSSDVDLTDTSESFGLPMTADFMLAMTSSEDMEALGQIMFKQLKNRYSDPNTNKRFIVGVDRDKMRLYNVEQDAQVEDNPVFGNTAFGSAQEEEGKPKSRFRKLK